MCAIAGITGLPAQAEICNEMLCTMARRGPDENGTYRARDCALLHSRLAIIDPEGGKQPMGLDWGGEVYILTYNGELYNTEEIRQDLVRNGHRFLGHSDTEVVLHAYVQWGKDCVKLFNGIFAFAVWEEQRGRLFLARDRIGVKPLFYKLHEDGLLFASEIKTILHYPGVRAELDLQGSGQLLLLGPGRIPGQTPLRGILELEPGQCGYYEKGRLIKERYWQLTDREHHQGFEDTAEQVRELVLDAIRRQTVSDVPIGCFLSGGLDSSIITAVCGKNNPALDTFSLDYQDNDRYFVAGKFQPNSDTEYIHLMEKQLGGYHHWTVLTPEDLMEQLHKAAVARDLPGMADVDASLLAFCGNIRSHVKVALSGECADEIFGGYPWYRDPTVRNTEGFPWAQNTAARIALMQPALREKTNGEDYVQQLYWDTVRSADILPGTTVLERRMKEMVTLNFRWFMQTLLDRKDRMSMYHGLEVRVPFCDYRIAEYLYGVPWEYKDFQGREKGLLRYAMRGLLPDRVLYRKKSPYPKTHHPQYMHLVRRALEDLLEKRHARIFELCDREQVRKLLDSNPQTPWYGQLMTLPQTFAYLLQMECWMEHYRVQCIN